MNLNQIRTNIYVSFDEFLRSFVCLDIPPGGFLFVQVHHQEDYCLSTNYIFIQRSFDKSFKFVSLIQFKITNHSIV